MDRPIRLITEKDISNLQAVEYLESLLEKARSGELTEIICVYKENGLYKHCWTNCDNLANLVGNLFNLCHVHANRMTP